MYITLGRDWEKLWQRYVDAERLSPPREGNANHGPDGRDGAIRWAVRYAWDIVEYFFPEPGDAPQPYFLPSRRGWDAPFDRQEFGLTVRWVRRQVKSNSQKGYIAFFVPSFETADALFDREYIRPNVAYAARESPDLLHVDVFHPTGLPEDAAGFLMLGAQLRRYADEEVRRRELLHGDATPVAHGKGLPRGVVWHEEEAAPGLPSRPVREMLAFAYFGYTREIGGVDTAFERIRILRPFCGDGESSPFVIDMSPKERKMFISAARRGYGAFNASLQWLHDGVPEDAR